MLAIGKALAEAEAEAAAGMDRVKTWLSITMIVSNDHDTKDNGDHYMTITSSGEKASSLDPGDLTAPRSAEVLFL